MRNCLIYRILFYLNPKRLKFIFVYSLLVYYLYSIGGDEFILGLGILVLLFSIVAFVFRFIEFFFKYSYIKNKKKENVVNFLSKIHNKEYCLILRPFGEEGMLYIKQDLSIIPEFFPGISSECVEEIIYKTAKKYYNLKTVIVNNPSSNFVPSKLKYISTTNSHWKDDLKLLISRSYFVFFIFPTNRNCTDSIEWEMIQTINMNFDGRIAFVFPPKKYKNIEIFFHTINTISKIYQDIDYEDDTNKTIEELLAVYIDRNGWINYYYEIDKSTDSNIYHQIVFDILYETFHFLENKDFNEKYCHFYKNKFIPNNSSFRNNILHLNVNPKSLNSSINKCVIKKKIEKVRQQYDYNSEDVENDELNKVPDWIIIIFFYILVKIFTYSFN